MEANVHDHRNAVSKDSAIEYLRKSSVWKQTLGEYIFHLQLLHDTADGFLSSFMCFESDLASLLLQPLQSSREAQSQ